MFDNNNDLAIGAYLTFIDIIKKEIICDLWIKITLIQFNKHFHGIFCGLYLCNYIYHYYICL